jgi:hypothetical protein
VIREAPDFRYYVDRARLVLALADGLGGSELKRPQYLQREYAETVRGERIGSVAARARARLEKLRAQARTRGIRVGEDD